MEWYWIVLIVIGASAIWLLLSVLLYKQFFKRFYDIVLSGLAIVVLSPIFIILIIAGAIAMRGNPFFTQQRPGKNEKIFKLIKFRSMDNRRDKEGNLLPDEIRLNKYGKFIRKTSLDELPELFNIFIGNMSIIGPRPLLVKYLPWYTESEKHRHDVRPGLTGYAQTHGRNFVEWEKRFEEDVFYVNHISLWMDISLVFATIKVVLMHSGVGVDAMMDFDEYRRTAAKKSLHVLETPIYQIDSNLWVKREDFIPFSFGGNKARKAALFFKEFDQGDFDCVVTYGSSSSNHCRIIANVAASRNIPCYIISPEESSEQTFNSDLTDYFGAIKRIVPVNRVHDTINDVLSELKSEGKKPYFIQGGGHGNLGTQAYVDCYEEIKKWENKHHLSFDYIFFASGTGTTQAGLICGKITHNDFDKKIVGISIARKSSRGVGIIADSIVDYLGYRPKDLEKYIVFDDSYIGSGYASRNAAVRKTIDEAMKNYGLPLDETYTGKAFYGMNEFLKVNNVKDKNILFIHTGGTPLFFDSIGK